MPNLSPRAPAVPPTLAAGLLLASIPILDSLHLPHPTATAAIEATGASRSRAYEVKAAIEQALPDLVRPPGRPSAPLPEPAPLDAVVAILRKINHYMKDHPGCVHSGPERYGYTDGFRFLVLDLWAQHKKLDLAAFAEATQLPHGTMKDWLRGGRKDVQNIESVNAAQIPVDKAKGPRIETILDAHKTWEGKFKDFCDHIQFHLHIPWGRTTIAKVLKAHGVRFPKRRRGRTPDEKATRGSFETFFGGGMWSADGSPLNVVVNGQTFTYNLELNVDTHTAALVGM